MTRVSMNPDDIRADLAARLSSLLQRSSRIQAHERELDREVPTDSEDRAQYREDDEVVDRLDDMTRSEIAAIRATLVRLDEGTFGTCGDCGSAIGSRRLEAALTSPWCARCAPRHETAPA